MATSTLTIVTPSGDDPLVPRTGQGSNWRTGSNSLRAKLRAFARLLLGTAGSAGRFVGTPGTRTTVRMGTAAASATATLATPVATNKVTINGNDVTAIQLNARATVTAGGSEANADTVTVAGVVFTAAASPSADPNAGQFALGSTSVTATNLAAAINAHPALFGKVTASTNAAVVNLRAVAAGTAGNAFTLATSAHFTVSGATFTGGAAAVGDQWDYGDTNAQGAAALAAAINASSTALIANAVTAIAAAAVVTLTAIPKGTPGNWIQLTKTGAPITLAGVTNNLLTGGTDTVTTM